MLKNLGIDLQQSEKKTLISFLSLYTFLCLLIIFFISFLYYNFQKDLMLQENKQILQIHTKDLVNRLKDLHINFDKYKYYPRDEQYNSAIYDSDKNLIFTTLKKQNISFDKVIYKNANYIHFITEPESYYLGAKFIILEIRDNSIWLKTLKDEIFIFSLISFLFMLIIGYFLLKLFLKPMRDSFLLLDNFIKDTTHELNTPLMAITSNIEMLKELNLDEKVLKKIKRIEIASKTVSNIYEDLTYLTLNNKIISQNENVNLKDLLNQRIEYFKSLAFLKQITFDLDIKNDVYLNIDLKKISKLIDNLISNAIKYNKIKGSIKINLKMNYLCIEDTGYGIKKQNIDKLFIRYSRFNTHVGGFGIGLNIVKLICDEYNIKINVTSVENEGTKMELRWEN